MLCNRFDVHFVLAVLRIFQPTLYTENFSSE
jgi:hypothetical protein